MTALVWLVTGSSRGLGRKIVEAALGRGDQVIATARNPKTLDDLVQRYPGTLRAIAQDVRIRAAADAAVALARTEFGGLDVVVNNAGYANLESVEDATEESFRDQLETVYFGTVHTTRAALPALRERGSGRIINVSSVGGRMGTAGLAAYQSAKWATNGFSEVLAKEVGPLGIHVTAIEPGGMATDWAGSSMTVPPVSEPYRPTVGRFAGHSDGTPLGDPAKVAQAVLRLVDLAEPPVRLLLGSESYTYATATARAQLASDEKWLDLTRSTDRDDATPAERDPLGVFAATPSTTA
jgi:NAD(P)-dependent dehydrogenase (short-subunit alcohol dehydrogenase family)